MPQTTDDVKIHLPYPLFDTHFHAFVMKSRGLDAENILNLLFGTRLVGAVDVAVDETGFSERTALANQFERIFLSAGIHPNSTSEEDGDWKNRFDILRRQAAHHSVAAIGETGLDFYRDHSSPERQEKAFRDQLELAAEFDKPIIIHNRNADERVLTLIKESPCRRGVFHCFSSGWETARRALDLGFYVSFAGNLTYKKTEFLRDAAVRIPPERILIETDAPFLSPQPVRGKLNHPGHIGHTLEALAQIRETDPAILAEQTVKNAHALFNLS